MIAYAFPPWGSAGVYRPFRFVRHLSKLGWSPTILSADPYAYERHDPDLLRFVPDDTDIIRVRLRDVWQAIQTRRERRIQEKILTATPDRATEIRAQFYTPLRSSLRKILRTAEACYYQPDPQKNWIGPATEAAVQACKRKRPEVIWATASPLSGWIVAQRASQRAGVPYILDLRDPLGLSYYDPEVPQPQWVKRRIRRTMYQLFKGAQSVVFLFDTVAESYCRAFPGVLDPRKIHIIPNGYEGAISEFAPTTGDKFTILYAGTIGSYRYDTLLQALALFKNADPNKANALRFLFVGECMDDLAQQATRLGLSEIVKATGPTSHAEITRLQQEAHAFLVLGRPSTVKGHELFAGAKLFGYLKARRPIFGVLPQDETKKILERVGVSTVARVDAPPEIVAILRQLCDAWSEGNLRSFLPDRAKCELYSAERQTAALVRALEGAPAAEPFVPGAVEIPPSLREEMVVNGGWLSTLRWT